MADDKLDSHKHRRKKPNGTPEWSETCIGFWTETNKENAGKVEQERRVCRGISILHLNKYANSKKVKSIPTQGIEIVIREGDEQDGKKNEKKMESKAPQKSDDEKLTDSHSDEATPKILQRVAENWGKRGHNLGQKLKKYYEDPSSSTEVITEVKSSVSKGYETTRRILSYCQPREKVKQISDFVNERAKSISKWWWE